MTKMALVTRLSDRNENTLSISPEQAIEDFKEEISKNPDYDKVILIALNNHNQEFKYTWFKGRMLTSEAIAVLNLALKDQLDILE